MHFVEQGNGVTFVPELAVKTLSAEQSELIRPFALPRPARCITLVHHRDYVRHAVVDRLSEVICQAVPKADASSPPWPRPRLSEAKSYTI